MKIFQRKPAQLLGGGAVHIDASKSRSVDADYPWEAAQATNQTTRGREQREAIEP